MNPSHPFKTIFPFSPTTPFQQKCFISNLTAKLEEVKLHFGTGKRSLNYDPMIFPSIKI